MAPEKMPHEDRTPEDDSRTKCGTLSVLSLVTLTFKLGRDFCTMHQTTKFHHHTFNHSEVITLTNKQTDKQRDAAENIQLALLCYATPVGNQHSSLRTAHVCVCHCAQLSYTTQHRTVLLIFPLILWTIIIAEMLFTGGEKILKCRLHTSPRVLPLVESL